MHKSNGFKEKDVIEGLKAFLLDVWNRFLETMNKVLKIIKDVIKRNTKKLGNEVIVAIDIVSKEDKKINRILSYKENTGCICKIISDIDRLKKVDKLFYIYNKTKKARVKKKLEKRIYALIR